MTLPNLHFLSRIKSLKPFNCLFGTDWAYLISTGIKPKSPSRIRSTSAPRRCGHLFQGRYKAILVDADEYLKQLSRYIHLNPIRANMVTELCSYLFSSYPAFIGQVKAPKWLEINWLLSLFGPSRRAAARNYRDYVEKVDIANLENPAKDITGGFILGGVEFVNWVKESFLSYRREKKEIPQIRQLKPRKTPVEIVEAESAFAKVIDLNPKHVTAHLGRDSMLSSRGMRTVAKACF